jgi:amicyanin
VSGWWLAFSAEQELNDQHHPDFSDVSYDWSLQEDSFMRIFPFRRVQYRWLLASVAAVGVIGTAAAQSDNQPAVNIVEGSPTDITSWAFDNPNLSIAAGQTVTWTNTGAQQHTVTTDDASVDSGLIDPDNTFSYEFDVPGTYTYHCTPHPWMKATVTVTGG